MHGSGISQKYRQSFYTEFGALSSSILSGILSLLSSGCGCPEVCPPRTACFPLEFFPPRMALMQNATRLKAIQLRNTCSSFPSSKCQPSSRIYLLFSFHRLFRLLFFCIFSKVHGCCFLQKNPYSRCLFGHTRRRTKTHFLKNI